MAKELTRSSGQQELETTRPGRQITPPVDIYENEQELLIVADIPGVEADGLDVALDPPELCITGRRGSDGTSDTYVRAFRIGEAVDPDGISAEVANGVLRVHLRKSAALRPRKIEVRAS